jgi:hypothetical protein
MQHGFHRGKFLQTLLSEEKKVPLKTVREQKQDMRGSRRSRGPGIIKMDNSKYLKKLKDSMPRRLQEVIARQGASTKY